MAELKRILLVEDSANDVELTLSAFADRKLMNEVVVVADGQAALDYLRRDGQWRLRTPGMPAVVLLDIKLPKIDGLEVLRRMREDQALRRVPVVMLTSSREERDLVTSYDHGANAFVVKPVGFDEFLGVVGELGLFWALVNEPPPLSVES
jgi:CheY-like chemotaxis protein